MFSANKPTRSPESICTSHSLWLSSNRMSRPTSPLRSSLPLTPSSITTSPGVKPSPLRRRSNCFVSSSTCFRVRAFASSSWMRSMALAGSSGRFLGGGAAALALGFGLPLLFALDAANCPSACKFKAFMPQTASGASPSRCTNHRDARSSKYRSLPIRLLSSGVWTSPCKRTLWFSLNDPIWGSRSRNFCPDLEPKACFRKVSAI
mmetsp:Transcript_104789/g.278794  ORF Transcript_104789/g.278794 Transcript_104789/m.278794 type:complete len:205 (-) Transcript_104789:291-905(-)